MVMQPHYLVLYIQGANSMESSDPSTSGYLEKKRPATKTPIENPLNVYFL